MLLAVLFTNSERVSSMGTDMIGVLIFVEWPTLKPDVSIRLSKSKCHYLGAAGTMKFYPLIEILNVVIFHENRTRVQYSGCTTR